MSIFNHHSIETNLLPKIFQKVDDWSISSTIEKLTTIVINLIVIKQYIGILLRSKYKK